MDAKKPTITLVYHFEDLKPETLTKLYSGPNVDKLVSMIRDESQRMYREEYCGGLLLVNHAAGYLRQNGQNLDAILVFNVDSRAKRRSPLPSHDTEHPPSYYIDQGVKSTIERLKEHQGIVKISQRVHTESDEPKLDDLQLLQILRLL